jgi:hypothetical protein
MFQVKPTFVALDQKNPTLLSDASAEGRLCPSI